MVLLTFVFLGELDLEKMWEETGWSVEVGGHPRGHSENKGRWDEDISSYSDDSNLNSPEIGRQGEENIETRGEENIETLSAQSDELDASVDLSPLASGVLMDRGSLRSKLLKKDWGTEDGRRKKPTNRRKYKLQTSTPHLQRGERGVNSVDCSKPVVELISLYRCVLDTCSGVKLEIKMAVLFASFFQQLNVCGGTN